MTIDNKEYDIMAEKMMSAISEIDSVYLAGSLVDMIFGWLQKRIKDEMKENLPSIAVTDDMAWIELFTKLSRGIFADIQDKEAFLQDYKLLSHTLYQDYLDSQEQDCELSVNVEFPELPEDDDMIQ